MSVFAAQSCQHVTMLGKGLQPSQGIDLGQRQHAM